MHFKTNVAGIPDFSIAAIKFTLNCKDSAVKFVKSEESHVVIDCVLHVAEIIQFLLHLLLELTFAASIIEKLQHKVQEKLQ